MSSSRSNKVDLIARQFSNSTIAGSRIFGRGTSILPKMIEAPVGELLANPNQPRRTIDARGIHELATSIEEHGLIQFPLPRLGGGEFRSCDYLTPLPAPA